MEAHPPYCALKPKFHYTDFHRNFPTRKVMDTNHESRKHKPSRHVEMFVTKSVTKSATSSWQSRGLVAYTNHESRRRDLCRGTFMICVLDKSSSLSGTCRRLCRKVGVMEFGLKPARVKPNSARIRTLSIFYYLCIAVLYKSSYIHTTQVGI